MINQLISQNTATRPLEGSSIVKWGDQLKTTKQIIENYMILELWGTKREILQNHNKPNKLLTP